MRVAARQKGQRSQVVRPVILPAPVGGWNARDSLADMPATDAAMLENWYPATTELILRYGNTEHATGLPGVVETLMTYSGGATNKFFAVSTGSCYDVTASGAVGAAEWSGASNSLWQYCNITNSGGSYLIAANGANDVYSYNGTVWANPSITGVTSADLNNPILHKSRLWFTEKNTLKTWYLGVNAISGAASAMDMTGVAQMGGYIVNHATWTIDAGAGVDDYYAAVTSNGEVIVYQGTDPSDATKWALKGVWRLGSPVGVRCLMKYAGDLLLICQDGVVPLSGALQSSRVNPRVALTDKIQFAVSNAVSTYGGNDGWELLYFPKENQLFLNVPLSSTVQEQYVMNTITRNWTRYTGWNARCWALFNDEPYFGGDGAIYKAWSGNDDNGADISSGAIQAFTNLGTSQIKRFTATRPIFRSNGNPTISASLNVDFDMNQDTSALSFTPVSYAAWDSATWDSGVWGGDFSIFQALQSANKVGFYAAPQVRVQSSGIDTRWVSTTILFEPGNVI